MTTGIDRGRSEAGQAALLAAVVGVVLVLALRTIGALPGNWLGWLLKYAGMA